MLKKSNLFVLLCLSFIIESTKAGLFAQEIPAQFVPKFETEQAIEFKLSENNQESNNNDNQLAPSFEQATISNYATKNWFGFRDKLEKYGISPTINYMNNNFQKLHGGKNLSNKTVAQGLTSVALDVDTEKLVHWKGGEIYVLFQNSTGASIDQDYVGDVQGINNFDTKPITLLTEYWVKQSLFSDKLNIKLGKQDANIDLAVIAPNVKFMNFALSSTKTLPIPTFPTTSGGISALFQPNEVFTFRAGWFKSLNPNKSTEIFDLFMGKGYFSIAEIDLFPKYRHFQGKQSYGLWTDSSKINNLSNTGTVSSNFGVYAGFHPLIYKENSTKDDTQGLSLISHFGWAPQDRNIVTRTYAFGLSYQGLINKRDNDSIGLGAGIATLSKYLEGARNETAIESFYLFQLKPWLFIQPDFQIVFHPGGVYKNAYVLALRSVITL